MLLRWQLPISDKHQEVLTVATPSAETQTTWRYCGMTAFGLQGHRKPQLAKSAHAPG